MKTRMCLSLIRDCQKERAKLYAYTVMSNHIHFIARPHELMTISVLVQRIKVNAISRWRKYLLESEVELLGKQTGLNRHAYWQNSFRGNPLFTKKVADEKTKYIHLNSVRAGIVESADDFVWSSSHTMAKGFFHEDESMDLAALKEFYRGLIS